MKLQANALRNGAKLMKRNQFWRGRRLYEGY